MGNPALAAAAGGGLCCTETDTGTESGTGNRKTKNVKIGVEATCIRCWLACWVRWVGLVIREHLGLTLEEVRVFLLLILIQILGEKGMVKIQKLVVVRFRATQTINVTLKHELLVLFLIHQRTVTHWFNQIGDGAVYRSGGINSSGVTTAELMPKHVAVEMDGNGRWTKNQESALKLCELCGRWGVQVFTVFAFSNDNLKYDLFEYALDFLGYIFCSVEPIWYLISLLIEIDFLLSLFETLKSELKIHQIVFVMRVSQVCYNLLECRNNVRISIIGDSSKLPKSLLKVINEVEEVTKSKTRLQLIVARDVVMGKITRPGPNPNPK
ncbi:hypothetical protein YC2023_118689 [Brassica napus]